MIINFLSPFIILSIGYTRLVFDKYLGTLELCVTCLVEGTNATCRDEFLWNTEMCFEISPQSSLRRVYTPPPLLSQRCHRMANNSNLDETSYTPKRYIIRPIVNT